MIKFKPVDKKAYDDPKLKRLADDNGWIELPADVVFSPDDFELAYIKINDIIYFSPTDEFWAEYNKAKTWCILNDTVKS